MLKMTTTALVIVAAALGGVVFFTQMRDSPEAQEAKAGKVDLFDFDEQDVAALTVTNPLQTLSFEKDENGVWQMTQPDAATASDASIAYLLNLATSQKSDRTINASTSDLQSYGLDQPRATVTLTLADQQQHTLVLGEYDFDRSFLYALVDPPAEGSESAADEPLSVLLVSPDFDKATIRSVDEWKAPATSEADGATSSDDTEQSPVAAPAPSASVEVTPSESAPATDVTPEPSASPT